MKYLVVFTLILFFVTPAYADIVWAVAGPLTGETASDGQSELAGIRQAVADINAAGGINGQSVIIKTYDDACDPKQSVAVANKIISENIHFVLNESCSAASLAALRVYNDEKTVVIHTLASNPSITDEGGSTIFRAMYRDDDLALVMANYIAKHESKKKLAIIHDKSTYGLGIAQYLKSNVNKAGIREITFEPYDPASHDYTVLATHLKAIGAEVVFIGGYPVDEGLITKQLRGINSNAQIYGGYISTVDYWRVAGSAGEGALLAFPQDPRKESTAKDVINRLRNSGVVVDGITLYSYAAAQILAEALTQTKGRSDPAEVAAVLHKGTFKTILGSWSFNPKGDVNNIHQVMYRWHDGNYAEVSE